MPAIHIDSSRSVSHARGNKLLASLPHEESQRLAAGMRSVPMRVRQILQHQDEPMTDVFFPSGGALSLVKSLSDGQVAEVATIGAEGAVGVGAFFGQRIAECDVVVRLPGAEVQVITTDLFNTEMERRGAFYNRVVRYNQALMSQIMQTTVCNSLHSAEQRCCRWLLMTRDRAGSDDFPLTHELVAVMLGVRRPTVTLVIARLQQMGLIEHRRGSMQIIDRERLEATSCECYRLVKTQMTRLLPDVERGLMNDAFAG